MKVPEGMEFQGHGYRLKAGDPIPEDLLSKLPDDHPLKTAQASAPPRAPRPAPTAKD
jgi:hypothetical protein